ncbi:MAG: DUF362 domain-containing protein [Actinobacteria bacterium]|nr:DUF362 domain-containing protein [Actinomycetota bacterium]
MNENDQVIIVKFESYEYSIKRLLDSLVLKERLESVKKVIIKPNLLESAPPPCTTDVNCVLAVINFIRENGLNMPITVIEGSGGCSTKKSFNFLGYEKLGKIDGVKLLDVDDAELIRLSNDNALAYREIYLPAEAFEGFFISIPALKDHLITGVTLGMKNLIGLLPEKYYGGYWSYKRSDVHRVGINNAILDLNSYLKIDLTIIDGRIGQQGSHLPGGRECFPKKNILIGSYDVLAADRRAAEILGHSPGSITHLKLLSEMK